LKQEILRPPAGRAGSREPPRIPESRSAALILSQVVADLAAELDRRGVLHSFLRGIDAHPHLPRGSDVDLCVRRVDVARFTEALESICTRHGARIHERFRAGFLFQFHLYVVEGERSTSFLTVDVHTAEAALGIPFLEAEELLSYRRHATGFRVPEAEVSALIDFLSPYLAGGEVKGRYARRLASVLDADGSRARDLARRLFGKREGEALCREIETADHDALRARFRRRRRRLLARRLLRAPLRSLTSLVAFAYGVRLRPLWRPWRASSLPRSEPRNQGPSICARGSCPSSTAWCTWDVAPRARRTGASRIEPPLRDACSPICGWRGTPSTTSWGMRSASCPAGAVTL